MPEFIERRKDGDEASGLVVGQGEITVAREGAILMAVTGVGVAVCVWDTITCLAGMSHFVEPSMRDPKLTTARFGNVAVFALISMMRRHAPRGRFEAHLFGGAVRDENDRRGIDNVEIARKVLVSHNIPVVSEDVGGTKGRKIMFDATTGHVAVLKVHEIRKEDWGVLESS